jgi:hypothetical protein
MQVDRSAGLHNLGVDAAIAQLPKARDLIAPYTITRGLHFKEQKLTVSHQHKGGKAITHLHVIAAHGIEQGGNAFNRLGPQQRTLLAFADTVEFRPAAIIDAALSQISGLEPRIGRLRARGH